MGHSAQDCVLVLIVKCRKVLDKQSFAGLLLTESAYSFNV